MTFTIQDLKSNREEIFSFFYKNQGVEPRLKHFMEMLVDSVKMEYYQPSVCDSIESLCINTMLEYHRGIDVKTTTRERRLSLQARVNMMEEDKGMIWHSIYNTWVENKGMNPSMAK